MQSKLFLGKRKPKTFRDGWSKAYAIVGFRLSIMVGLSASCKPATATNLTRYNGAQEHLWKQYMASFHGSYS